MEALSEAWPELRVVGLGRDGSWRENLNGNPIDFGTDWEDPRGEIEPNRVDPRREEPNRDGLRTEYEIRH